MPTLLAGHGRLETKLPTECAKSFRADKVEVAAVAVRAVPFVLDDLLHLNRTQSARLHGWPPSLPTSDSSLVAMHGEEYQEAIGSQSKVSTAIAMVGEGRRHPNYRFAGPPLPRPKPIHLARRTMRPV